MTQRLIAAGAVAAVGAALLAIPEIWGIATWKWALGIVGAWLFVTAGRRASTGK